MKKNLVFSAAALMLALVSCGSDDFQQTLNFSTPVVNLITDLSTGTTTISSGVYSFGCNITTTDQVATVTSQIVNNNNTMNLVTNAAEYQTSGYNVLLKNVTGNVTGNVSGSLSNTQFFATPFYYYSTTYIGDYTYNYNSYLYAGIIKYNIGTEYAVKTFPQNAFFVGETNTSYGTSTNKTEDIIYRIDLYTDNSGNQQARIIIYNAKFSGSPNEPTKIAILLTGLDVNISQNNIILTGNDIIPKVYEANGWTDYERYTFNSITFTTTDPLFTKASINYQVAGIYTGSFTGAYISDDYLNK